jgi:hypothetical protein
VPRTPSEPRNGRPRLEFITYVRRGPPLSEVGYCPQGHHAVTEQEDGLLKCGACGGPPYPPEPPAQPEVP